MVQAANTSVKHTTKTIHHHHYHHQQIHVLNHIEFFHESIDKCLRLKKTEQKKNILNKGAHIKSRVKLKNKTASRENMASVAQKFLLHFVSATFSLGEIFCA